MEDLFFLFLTSNMCLRVILIRKSWDGKILHQSSNRIWWVRACFRETRTKCMWCCTWAGVHFCRKCHPCDSLFVLIYITLNACNNRMETPSLSAAPLPWYATNSNLHILEVCVWVWGVLEQQSFSFDGLKKEKMLVPLTDWLMNNQISQHECWGGNLVARHAPNPWNSASLMWRPV